MEKNTVKILLIEDNKSDAADIEALLKKSKLNYKLSSISNIDSITSKIKSSSPDIVFLDLTFPQISGLDSFIRVKNMVKGKPVIIFSEFEDDHLALSAVKKGAQDYLIKTKTNEFELKKSILFALERNKSTDDQNPVNYFPDAINNINDAVFILNSELSIVFKNRKAAELIDNFGQNLFNEIKSKIEKETYNDLLEIKSESQELPDFYKMKIIKSAGIDKAKYKVFLSNVTDLVTTRKILSNIENQLREKIQDRYKILDEERVERKISESRLTLITANMVDIVCQTDIAGNIEWISGSVNKLMGYREKDIIGKNVSDFAANPEEVKKFIEKSILGGANYSFESKFFDKNSNEYYFHLYLSKINSKSGKQSGFIITARNISEKKTIEEKLELEKNYFDTLMESIPDSIYFKDIQSRFLRVSKATVTKFNLKSADDLLGKTDFDLFSNEHALDAFKDEQKIIETGVPIINKEEMETWPDGTVTWASSTKLPVFDKNNDIIGTFGISRDITEMVRTRNRINEINMELKESNASKDKFFSIIAHDLKSPFTALLGYSEIIENEFEEMEKEEIKEFIFNIHTVAKKTYGLLENLLDWSRIQTGRIEYKPSVFNINEVAEDVKELYLDSADSKHISIVNKVSEKCQVYADKNMIYTVMRNFVSNALKYTSEKGLIYIYSKDKADRIEISVQDNGTGMDKETLELLFKVDVHKSEPGTSNEQGTGLGLILSKELIEKNNGTIHVESEPGEGSIFSFTLLKPLN